MAARVTSTGGGRYGQVTRNFPGPALGCAANRKRLHSGLSSMSPSVEYASIGIDPVAGLRSRRATADILLIHDHRALGYTAKRWTVSGVVLGVGRRITRIRGRSLERAHVWVC